MCRAVACILFLQVEEAFATLETWQEIAAGLPALVDRLQALETLHLASASFAQRLEQVKTDAVTPAVLQQLKADVVRRGCANDWHASFC